MKFEELTEKQLFILDLIAEILTILREESEEDARVMIAAMYDANPAPEFVQLIEGLYNMERART